MNSGKIKVTIVAQIVTWRVTIKTFLYSYNFRNFRLMVICDVLKNIRKKTQRAPHVLW